jgi:hypothetical protein
MPRFYRFLIVFILAAATLACGLITGPIDQAKNLAATAQAMASAIPSGMPSGIPNIPGLPNVGDYLNPQGAPVSEWNGIPIMPQATAGQEFDSTKYSFRAPVASADVQTFYKDKLTSLGWTQPYTLPGGTDVGFMLFQKEGHTLTISITPQDKDVVVLFFLA